MGICWTQAGHHVQKFIHQGLAVNTEQQMFEIIVRQIHISVCVFPQLHCRHMWFFFRHTILDSGI